MVPADAVVMAFGFRHTTHGMAGETRRGTGLAKGRIIAPERSDNAEPATKNLRRWRHRARFRLVVTAIAEGRKAADGIMNLLEV